MSHFHASSPPRQDRSPILRVVRDEDPPPYDGTPSRARGRHMTMIRDEVVESVMAECGLVALGVYTYLERRVGKDGTWTESLQSIADRAGVSVRHVRDAAEKLEKAGYVTRTIAKNRSGLHVGITFLLPHHGVYVYPEGDPEAEAEGDPEASRARVPGVSNYVSNYEVNNGGSSRSNGTILTTINPNESTWLLTLGSKVDALARKFGDLSSEFTAGMVRGALLDAEADVGAVPETALLDGLKAAHAAIERSLAAERKGGKPIANLRPYTAKILATKVREAAR